ncbi:hypothetical protein STXM2123_1399 [Streptomyces sp. F-3]|nr:hypothetical protein STXM2123_1399 [Streptomyces sp. F-3]
MVGKAGTWDMTGSLSSNGCTPCGRQTVRRTVRWTGRADT